MVHEKCLPDGGARSVKAKVLAVDDYASIRELVKSVLDHSRNEVILAEDGAVGLREFFQQRPDLVLLDVIMPNMTGYDLLERIREVADTPVIMLSAVGEEAEKVRGLRGGADDYIVKPFGPGELVARCEAVLRRAQSASTEPKVVFEDAVLRIDFARHEVYVRGERTDLSPTEFRLLSGLVRNANAVLSFDTLMNFGWEEGYGTPEGLRVYVGYLRKKLKDYSAETGLIETVRGFGYRYRPAIR